MPKSASFREFVALMALSMSLVALAIDIMLPALSQIAQDVRMQDANDRQLVITFLFIGLSIGQLAYGPVSDSFGRRPPIYFGFILFIIGSLVAAFSNSEAMLLFGRFLQGLGAAGPRIITFAIVRDGSAGREMARVMSLIMMVFILVPAIAPAIGQVILQFSDWRMIFLFLVVLSGITMVWFHLRQPETLAPEKRQKFSIRRLSEATLEIANTRVAVIYMVASGLVFGAFLGFINSAQQILQELYRLGDQFPLYFASLALTIGLASWSNSRLVVRYGMRLLCRYALWAIGIASGIFFVVIHIATPPLSAVMGYLMIVFFATGILMGNLNAMAMEPLGHVAGLASSVIGSVTTLISLTLGFLIGAFYDETLMPLVGGFLVLTMASLILMKFDQQVPGSS